MIRTTDKLNDIKKSLEEKLDSIPYDIELRFYKKRKRSLEDEPFFVKLLDNQHDKNYLENIFGYSDDLDIHKALNIALCDIQSKSQSSNHIKWALNTIRILKEQIKQVNKDEHPTSPTYCPTSPSYSPTV